MPSGVQFQNESANMGIETTEVEIIKEKVGVFFFWLKANAVV